MGGLARAAGGLVDGLIRWFRGPMPAPPIPVPVPVPLPSPTRPRRQPDEDPAAFEPRPNAWVRGVFDDMKAEFRRQYYALTPRGVKTELLWVIHTWAMWRYMSRYINPFNPAPFSSAEHRIYAGWNAND